MDCWCQTGLITWSTSLMAHPDGKQDNYLSSLLLLVGHLLLLGWHLLLVANLVTTSKAPVTTSVAPVTTYPIGTGRCPDHLCLKHLKSSCLRITLRSFFAGYGMPTITSESESSFVFLFRFQTPLTLNFWNWLLDEFHSGSPVTLGRWECRIS